jgi:hypothetical protein
MGIIPFNPGWFLKRDSPFLDDSYPQYMKGSIVPEPLINTLIICNPRERLCIFTVFATPYTGLKYIFVYV